MRAAPDVGDGAGRSANRGRWIIGLTLVAAIGALGAVPATAQEPVPAGHYGGGAVPAPSKPIYGPGSLVLSLRTTGAGTVQILAGMGARCGTATIRANATLAPDGSFTATGTEKENVFGGRRLRTKYTIAGTITGANASGTASASSRDKIPGRTVRKCKTGDLTWGARQSFGVIGTPGAAPPAGRLYGNTTQSFDQRRHGILLHISDDGTQLTRALYTFNYRCGSFTEIVADTPKPNLTIKADGTVSNVETFRDRLTSRVRLRTVERFNAIIGSSGATGSFKITARAYDRRTGRTLFRCRSKKVKWTAAL